MHDVPWETIGYVNEINEIVLVWNINLEIINKHAPLKSHRIKENINQTGFPHTF